MKKQAKHIRYLRWLVDFIISHLVIVLLFVAFFMVVQFIRPLGNLVGVIVEYALNVLGSVTLDNQNYFNFVAKTLFSAIFSVLASRLIAYISAHVIKRNMSNANQRRKVYKFWNRFYRKYKNFNYVSLLFINIFLQGRPLDYNEQQKHIEQLSDLVRGNAPDKHITWIFGDAHSGKTTIIFRFLEKLADDKNQELYERFERKIYYFDLGSDSLNIGKIYNAMDSGTYSNRLLILDNIHKLNSTDLRNFIVTMETGHRNVQHIICLSRKLSSFCYSQESCDRLDCFIKDNAVCIAVTSHDVGALLPIVKRHERVAIEQIAIATQDRKNDFEKFCLSTVGEIAYSDPILAIQCYNLFWAAQSSKKKRFIYQVFDLLNNQKKNNILASVLSFIVHASLFSGGFDNKWLNEYLSETYKGKQLFLAKSYFAKLQRACFISLVRSAYIDEFVFHELLSRYYFNKITSQSTYRQANSNALKYLISKNIQRDKYVNAWKYALLIDPESTKTNTLFDRALECANFKTLLEDMQFIRAAKGWDEAQFYRELGILHDRIGNLHVAAEYFTKLLDRAFDPVVYINQIQVDHSKYSEDKINELITSDDPYCMLAAQYWEAHIKIHDGIFDFDAFQKIASLLQKHKTTILKNHPYDGIHLIRRWYFDCFRCYYLSGQIDPSKLAPLLKSEITSEIRQLAEFEAYDAKFRSAFHLHYDLLFLCGVYGNTSFEQIEKWDNIMLEDGVTPRLKRAYETTSSITEALIDLAEYYYALSRDALKQVMDKSYRYSDLRLWELKLAREAVDFKDIRQNEKLLMQYIQHSKDIHIDEYVAYGYTYLLKNYLVGMFCYTSEYDDNPESGRIPDNLYITDKKIQTCFSEIQKYHGSYRNSRNNSYCEFRLEFYRALYKTITGRLKKPSLTLERLLSQAIKQGYHREEKLLLYLLDGNINRRMIIQIFKFYPLVLQ